MGLFLSPFLFPHRPRVGGSLVWKLNARSQRLPSAEEIGFLCQAAPIEAETDAAFCSGLGQRAQGQNASRSTGEGRARGAASSQTREPPTRSSVGFFNEQIFPSNLRTIVVFTRNKSGTKGITH